jgi:hypothetical protein
LVTAGTVITVDATSSLSFAVDTSANTKSFIVIDTGTTTRGITAPFQTVIGRAGGNLTRGTDFDLIYHDTTAAPFADQTNPVGSTFTGGATFTQLIVKFKNTAVTPVTLDAFAAKADGAGVALSWNAISEFQNAGFNVYRRALEEQDWTRVNTALIAGRVTSADLKAYRFYDWAAPGAYEYKLESVSIKGERETYAKLAGPVDVDGIEAALSSEGLDTAAANMALRSEIERAEALSAKFDATADAQLQAAQDGGLITAGNGVQAAASASARAFDAQGRPAATASVRELGLDAVQTSIGTAGSGSVAARAASGTLTAQATATAGARWFTNASSTAGTFTGAKVVYSKAGLLLIPQRMLPAGFNANRVSITREGRAVTALAVTADGVLVFGQGYQDDYTDKDALFLRRSGTATVAGQVTHAQGLFAGTQTVNVDSPASVMTDYHEVYFDFSLRPYSFAPWFSSQYLTNGTAQSFSVSTPGASSGVATLTLNLWSLTQNENVTFDHELQVLVNEQPVGQVSWSGGGKMMQLSFQVASGVLQSGANKIDLVTPQISGVDSQIAFVHSMNVDYTRSLDGSKLLDVYNSGSGSKLFELSNVADANAWVVDVRYPDRAALVPYETQAQGDGTYKLRFNASAGGTGHYTVVPAGQENLPTAVSRRTVKPVKLAAYLAVGPSQFGAGVQPLLVARSKEGLHGVFVDQEQIFDYYNFGRFGPTGIQNAVRSARPQFLLLLGRTTYDYRDYGGLGVDPLCPTFLVSTTFWAQATSDSIFGDLGRGMPEVAVGRLPANNPAELGAAVKHIIAYTGLSSSIRAHTTADRFDAVAGDFAAEADSLAQAHPEVAWQKNYLGVTYQTSPEVTQSMKDAANGGADILIYIGHGNATRLGNEVPRILDTVTVQEWTGNVVFLQSTCTANWMAKNEDGYRSIAIQALTQPQGGISASIASSTYMSSESATAFMNQLLANANAGSLRWGNALLKTQQWAYSQRGTSGMYMDLSNTEQIFGDPAMPVMSKSAVGGTVPGGTGGSVTGGTGASTGTSPDRTGVRIPGAQTSGGSTSGTVNKPVLPGQF